MTKKTRSMNWDEKNRIREVLIILGLIVGASLVGVVWLIISLL